MAERPMILAVQVFIFLVNGNSESTGSGTETMLKTMYRIICVLSVEINAGSVLIEKLTNGQNKIIADSLNLARNTANYKKYEYYCEKFSASRSIFYQPKRMINRMKN
jgi:hypothetical protein